MNEEEEYEGWKEADDFDVKSLEDYEDFFEREKEYFYEQEIYT